MGFSTNSLKKSPKLGMLMLMQPMRPRKHSLSDDSNSTASTVGVGDDDSKSSSDHPPLLLSGNQGVSGEKGTSAYNFDVYKDEEELEVENVVKPAPAYLRTPLPCFDQSYAKLAALSSSAPSPKAASMVSYRWNMENDAMDAHDAKDDDNVNLMDTDVLRPFFTFGTAASTDDDESMDYSASTRLLHADSSAACGASSSSKGTFFKPISSPWSPFSSSSSSSFSSSAASCFTPRIPFRRKKETDGSVYLMHETALSNDWSERQLAFDLEVLEDDPSLDDAPSWPTMQPKDIRVIEPSQIAIGNSLYLLPPALLQPIPGTPKPPELKIQQTMYDGLMRGSRKSVHRKSASASAVSSSSSSTRYHRRGSSKGDCTGMATRGSSSGRTSSCGTFHLSSSKSSRKSSRRGSRGSPILRGRQFSPNLSTVPERPSEEDASYSLTPRNNSSSNNNTPTAAAAAAAANIHSNNAIAPW